ncbi:MAG: DUF502 domain-containing protein [Chlamydiae bacterium]|nr:DUF502 domain-containing protein [Chlamydiota bacterium]
MFAKVFKRGLIAVAPIALTVALLQWLFSTLEGIFSVPIKAIIGEQYYFKGMGIAVALVLIILVGFLINSWIMQRLSSWGESIVTKIPLVKTLYNSIGEMMGYFSSGGAQKQTGVVIVEYLGMKVVGLVTRETFEGLPQEIGQESEIIVYIPLSYQIGGLTVVVPKSSVKYINMTVEEGMRFCMTAGMLNQNKKLPE